MHDRNKHTSQHSRLAVILAFAVIAMIAAGGCAATHEPSRWSKSVGDMETNVYGSWVWLTLEQPDSGKGVETFGGELIAVSADSLYVASPHLRVVSRKMIARARLAQYDGYEGGVIGVSIVGSLLCLSNGAFGLMTMPMWWIGGTVAATTRSYTPVFDYTGETCSEMTPFARYPAGLPGAVTRSSIIMHAAKRALNWI